MRLGIVLGAAISLVLCIGIMALAQVAVGEDRDTGEEANCTLLPGGWIGLVWLGTEQEDVDLFRGCGERLLAVYHWVEQTQTFQRYVPTRPDLNTLLYLRKGGIYWLLMAPKSENLPATQPGSS